MFDLAAPSLSKWLKGVGFDWTIIIIGFVLFRFAWGLNSWLGMLGCMIVIGARQHGLALMGHEGAHKAISRKKWVNDLLTQLCTFGFLGFALKPYRKFHFDHHRLVGTEADPELRHKLNPLRFYRQWTLPLRKLHSLTAIFDFIGGAIPHIYYATILINPSLLVILYQLIWVLFFVTIGLAWVPILWYACLLSTFWLAFRLRIWTEHVVEISHKPTQRITATWWQRFLFLPHRTYCHWEHHHTWDTLKLAIPCWNLPKVRSLIAEPKPISLRELIQNPRRAPRSLGTTIA